MSDEFGPESAQGGGGVDRRQAMLSAAALAASSAIPKPRSMGSEIITAPESQTQFEVVALKWTGAEWIVVRVRGQRGQAAFRPWAEVDAELEGLP